MYTLALATILASFHSLLTAPRSLFAGGVRTILQFGSAFCNTTTPAAAVTPTSDAPPSRGLTGVVYMAQEHIHRSPRTPNDVPQPHLHCLHFNHTPAARKKRSLQGNACNARQRIEVFRGRFFSRLRLSLRLRLPGPSARSACQQERRSGAGSTAPSATAGSSATAPAAKMPLPLLPTGQGGSMACRSDSPGQPGGVV